jgi:putative FmdB family regulatory protein
LEGIRFAGRIEYSVRYFKRTLVNAMPLFDFHCDDCDADIELLIRGSEEPECPDCHSQNLHKQLSAPAAHVSSGGMPMADFGGGCGKPQCGQGRCMGGM